MVEKYSYQVENDYPGPPSTVEDSQLRITQQGSRLDGGSRTLRSVDVYVCISRIHTHTYTYMFCMCIYIDMERERERENVHLIYMYAGTGVSS